tara:strand:+ start:658 stop:1962 length:1305 start_codon:yes stop_codon:yes gene_type:complete
MKIKKIIILIFSLIILIFFINANHTRIKFISSANSFLEHNLSKNIYVFIKLLFNNKINTLRVYNDYNTKFLPNTEFVNLNLEKIKIDEFKKDDEQKILGDYTKKYVSYFFSRYKNNLFLASNSRKIIYTNIDKISSKKLNFISLDHNLKDIRFKLRDMIIDNDKIYVSSATKVKDKCEIIEVYVANLNISEKINFKNLFTNSECSTWSMNGGKLAIWNYQGQRSILLSTSGDERVNGIEIDPKPQDDSSIYGKVLVINEDNGSYKIFSKGHRNIIGLYSNIKDNIILATENGPKGGDEINRILFGKNYGWDKASYGKKYINLNLDDNIVDYELSHEDNGFEEPLYAFVPSIGISEIIKIQNNFSKNWFNNYLIASLNSRHLYRVKFNNNFSRVLFSEKIYIGERIRDLIYLEDKKQILLALEETQSIGIIEIAK